MATSALLSRDDFFAAVEAGNVTTVERFLSQSSTLQAVLAVEAGIRDDDLIEHAGQELIRTEQQSVVPLDAWIYRGTRWDFVFGIAISIHHYGVVEWFYTSPLAPFLRRTLQFYLLDTAVAAVVHKEYHIFEMLLETQAWIEFPDQARPKFLTMLIRSGIDWRRSPVLRILSAHGADFHRPLVGYGSSLHHTAIHDPKGAIAYDLREHGTFTVGENTALHRAPRDGRHDVIRVLIELGVDPRARDHASDTPLHHAAREGCDEAVAMLLEHARVDVDARNENGDTPLTVATRANLFSNDDDEPPKDDDEDRDPRVNWPRVIDLLLDAGADSNVHVNNNGDQRTPLHLAVEGLSIDVVRRLLARGVDPNVPSPVRRETPGHLLAENDILSKEMAAILELLIQHGANLELVDANGNTTLGRLCEKPWWYPLEEDE